MIGITNDMGQTVARYRYDAWGACTIVADTSSWNIATINPFRYRGYYLDSETGLYYLQSRYYDPNTGRFINADSVGQLSIPLSVFSANLFAYCGNNAVVNSDHSGEAFFTALLIGFVVGAAISGISKVISNRKKGKLWYDGLAISMLAGGVGGAISCITIPGVSSWVCAAVFGASGNLVTKVILGEIKTLKDVTDAMLQGAIAGLLGNAAAKILNKYISAKFARWTKSQQKDFLGRIGKITNKTLKAIRKQIKSTGSTKAIEKSIQAVLDKYGYPLVVSAFVSSIATSV